MQTGHKIGHCSGFVVEVMHRMLILRTKLFYKRYRLVNMRPQFTIFVALFVLLFQVVAPTTATAASDVYTINRFEVTLDQQNSTRARQEAIDKATREGFAQLLRSLTAQSAADKIPQILENTNYNQVLEQYDLLEESTSPQYRAVFKLEYSRSYIRNLLKQYSVAFTEVGAGTVLLLPLLELQMSSLLWEETNPWRVKLEQAAKKSNLVRFVLPIGDPQEMMMLTPEMVAFGASDMIQEVAKKYDAPVAVVARFKMGMLNGQREALLDLTWHGENVEPQYLQVPLKSDEGLDAAMTEVADQAIKALEEAWRKLYVVELDKPGRLLVHYKVGDLQSLETLRKQLAGVPIVNDVLLRAVSKEQSVFQVNYYGTPEKLKTLAGDQQVSLLNWGTHWVVDLGSVEANTTAYGPQPESPAFFRHNAPEQAIEEEHISYDY